jgi:transposase
MSKGRYHSVECKGVDWKGLGERVAGAGVVFAVDVAKHDFVGLLSRPGGEVLARVRWRHPEQTRELLAGIATLGAVTPIEAVMESSGTYGDALRWQLGRLGVALYRVAAKRVHDAAEVYDGVPSLHDAKAVELISELHARGCSAPWPVAQAPRRALQAQLRMLRQSKQREQALRNRQEALLSRHWPEVLTVLEPASLTLHHLIAAFGGPQQVTILASQARALMQRVGRAGLGEEKIEAVLGSAADTLGVPCVLEERELLRWQAKALIETHGEIDRIERRIAETLGRDAELAALPKSLGRVTGAVLWATVGSPAQYPNAASYCKALGLNLKEHSSGTHAGRVAITKRGPPLARFYLYFAALRLIAQEPLVARWFTRKSARPGALKGKQVVELMRRMAKGLWHHVHGQPFRIDKLFNSSVSLGA